MSASGPKENVDTIVKGWYVVTMNATRDIIRNGAVAIRGRDIVAVGKASDIEARLIGNSPAAKKLVQQVKKLC